MFLEAPRSIVILRALQFGDLLCSVPAFRALRAAFPRARISLVGLPWAGAFVRRFSSYLDEFIPFPGWPGLPEQEPDLQAIPSFLAAMQSRRFDLALQMQGSGTITNPLVHLFGARQAAGYHLPGQFRLNEQLNTVYPDGTPEVRVWLGLMEALGVPQQGEHLEFPVTDEEKQSFAQFLERCLLSAGSYICLHPGARSASRRWGAEKFAAVGDALSGQGYQIVLTGSEAERDLTQATASQMYSPVIDAAGKTDPGMLALLLANARLLICNDTGVSHLAAAVQTPSVILFNASDPERWRPLNRSLHRAVVNADQANYQEVLRETDYLLKEPQAYAGQNQ